MNERPPIGTTVHYTNGDSFDTPTSPCLPAIVTDYYGDELGLFVIDHGDTFVAQAARDDGEFGFTARTWHPIHEERR